MMDPLRYPVGRFMIPDQPRAELIPLWIGTLTALPDQLEAELQRFDECMLDTPYRPGGWTGRQVFHHIADSHINAYIRFKLALTEELPVIKPYMEERWANLPDTALFPVTDSIQLTRYLHARWVVLLREMSESDYERKFVHPQNQKVYSLFEVLGMYDWHSRHHLAHLKLIQPA